MKAFLAALCSLSEKLGAMFLQVSQKLWFSTFFITIK
jgi:hypothetical protein